MPALPLDRYRENLLEMRDRVRSQAEHITEAIQEEGRSPGDLSDLPTHNADRDSEGLDAELELKRSEEQLLEAITAALASIEDGTFGTCERCEKPIGTERLEALPFARLCIDCARQD